MKNTVAMMGLAFACAAGLAQAQGPAEAPRERYVALLGSSLAGPDDKRHPPLDGGFGANLRFGDRPENGGWGYELRLFQEILEQEDGDTGNRGGVGADAIYRFPQVLFVTPYGLGGMALAYSDALPGRDWVAPVVNAGVGLESGPLVRLWGGALRLRVEGRYGYEDNRDEYTTPAENDPANYVETRIYAGLSLSFAPPPAKPPEPIGVVAPEPAPEAPPSETAVPVPAPLEPAPMAPAAPGDADGDGVTDDADRCPDSPAGKPVDLEGCTILKVLTLEGVTFENNSSRLRDESFPVLDAAVAALNAEFPAARIEVSGHTDSNGSDSYNQKLSERRAESVRDYLVGKGVAVERLSATGYGETVPVADNATAEGRGQNRRVELRVKSD